MTARDGGTAAGITQIESYLMAHADIGRARKEAEDLVGRLPWLTTAQRRDVAAAYTEQRLRTARADQDLVAARCAALEAEFGRRLQQLRIKVTAVALAAIAAAGFLYALSYVLVHH